MTEVDEYVYRVQRVERIVDGDTYFLHLDVGFRQSQLTCIRLKGFDTPEKNSTDAFEREKAGEATRFVVDWFATEVGRVLVATEKDPDSFGRWLGTVWTDESNLGTALLNMGLATVWPMRWREGQ